MMQHRSRATCPIACVGFVLAMMLACGGRPPEPIELLPGRPTSTGLRRVDTGGETGIVFVRPGVRMADYSELIVDPFMLSYSSGVDPSDDPVRMLDVASEERFKEVAFEAFVDKMKYSRGFSLVDRPGPRTVRVQGWLYDLVLEEPPSDDRRNFPLCFGHLTLLLTVRDAETAQPLAEVGERMRLTCPTRPGGYATTSWRAVGRGVEGWAGKLRGWLEQLHALPPIEE